MVEYDAIAGVCIILSRHKLSSTAISLINWKKAVFVHALLVYMQPNGCKKTNKTDHVILLARLRRI